MLPIAASNRCTALMRSRLYGWYEPRGFYRDASAVDGFAIAADVVDWLIPTAARELIGYVAPDPHDSLFEIPGRFRPALVRPLRDSSPAARMKCRPQRRTS